MSFPTLRVELSLANPGITSPAWQDITDYVTTLTTKRGRQYELDQIQAGTCTLTLDNNDRRFDPSYTLGPYYGGLRPMNRIRVSATWDTAYGAGAYGDGPYGGTATYYLFTGFVERWPPQFSRPSWNQVTITATDAFMPLANAAISGTFASQTTGSRIADILAAANWATSVPAVGYWTLGTSALGTATRLSYPIPTTVLDTGKVTLPAITFAASAGQQALAHIQDVVGNTERGVFFIDGQGRLVFHDRYHRLQLVTPSVTITDSTTASTSTSIRYADITPSMDADHVANDITVTASGTTNSSEVTDTTSIDTYFRRTLSISAQLATDAEAINLGRLLIRQTKDAMLRFDSVTLEPWTDDNQWPHALGREISDRVAIQLTPPSTPDITAETISQTCHIEAIQHVITPPLTWETTLQLSPRPADFWILGTSALGAAAVAA
jgi:hypothetical protein